MVEWNKQRSDGGLQGISWRIEERYQQQQQQQQQHENKKKSRDRKTETEEQREIEREKEKKKKKKKRKQKQTRYVREGKRNEKKHLLLNYIRSDTSCLPLSASLILILSFPLSLSLPPPCLSLSLHAYVSVRSCSSHLNDSKQSVCVDCSREKGRAADTAPAASRHVGQDLERPTSTIPRTRLTRITGSSIYNSCAPLPNPQKARLLTNGRTNIGRTLAH
ncbi:hypothetical protein P175DRAFT_019195 [Aspergillus ochraceoroseus IBT 24754]|uniref:Uncharacterized protein n=1 Tax=Aspergillus ochraceoroseus IBT 24754 TaxID=1392256 RepID=A0A2T5M6F5_9EURO|nr:uncharacterized protein P175DRAFT_019195 [Aspergillus ochraceoroseus IBT 24754]PTU24086.1 hypothetical protein P175DRAFT_019195 [Aspergillus ochraceoroseus IBT 24754]